MSLTLCQAPFQTCEAAMAFIDALDASVLKLGTERIKQVLHTLGNPQDQIKTIHVVGTNGKGSTSAMLASIYTAAGYQTGLYTSPHLVEIRERIQRQSRPLSAEKFLEAAQAVYTAMVMTLPAREDWLTYFEYLTVMAFWRFATDKVDIAIIEAGMGGRLDGTNVIAKPEAVVVTALSMDHMASLGNTLAKIAAEKAGVFRPNVPVFTGAQPDEAWQVLVEKAHMANTRLITVDASKLVPRGLVFEGEKLRREVWDTVAQKTYHLILLGRYQIQNLAVVLAVVSYLDALLPVDEAALVKGLKTVYWPGRFQHQPTSQCVIDGSHNPAGFDSLLETLALDFPNVPIHWGISLLANRAVDTILPLLEYPMTRAVHFLAAEPAGRSPMPKMFQPPEAFQALVEPLNLVVPVFYGHTPQIFHTQNVPAGELKVLTGSLYTAGEVLRWAD